MSLQIKMPENPGLIAVAMSGGVDSSVAAALLAEQGFNVVGVTMKLWDAGKSGELNDKTCCTLDSSMDARRVCDQIGIPHYTLDMTQDFEDLVIQPFYTDYMEAKTPNPCVNCNSFVKWDALYQRVRSIGATHMATGHYAETEVFDGRRYITRGQDLNKDQSYFLWGIPPETLNHTIFPVTGLSKPEVREIARKAGLRTADKKESMDICFIPDGNKDRFLSERAEEQGAAFSPGDILSPEGKIIGKHRGLPFYTIGQRKGLGVSTGEPVYVKNINVEGNTLELGRKEDVVGNSLMVAKLNRIIPELNALDIDLKVQVRYRSQSVPCEVEILENGNIQVVMLGDVTSITPGQSAVFYDGNRVIGGCRIAVKF
jgi:tRNA-specific 2-thiouridylase